MKYNHPLNNFFIAVSVLIAALNSCKPNTSESDNKEPVEVKGDKVYVDSGFSSVKVFDNNGRVCIQQTSTNYEMADAYEGNSKIPLLVKVTKTDLCFADSVNHDKVYQLSAKSVMDTKSVSWELQALGTTLNMSDKTNTILVVHEGTGTEEDLITRYSLLTGEEVFTCSYSDMKVSIPNSKDRRFIGFVSRNAVTQPVQNRNEENMIGLINYSSNSKKIATLKLKLKRSAVAANVASYSPEMALVPINNNTTAIDDGKGLILMKANEKYTSSDVKDFAIQFTYYIGSDNEATVISIPVVNDKPDWKNASYDKDLFELGE